jgi:undecaprenyl-diphosphatase
MIAISASGFRPQAQLLTALTSAVLYVRGYRIESGLLLAGMLASSLGVTVIKHLVSRPRPTNDLVQVFREPGGYSFPSGHVMYATVFLAILAFTVTRRMRPSPVRGMILAIALAAVGASRVYLGAHWTSDALAGYAFGAVLVAIVIGVSRRWLDRSDASDATPIESAP